MSVGTPIELMSDSGVHNISYAITDASNYTWTNVDINSKINVTLSQQLDFFLLVTLLPHTLD
jgi:hypothetical protein